MADSNKNNEQPESKDQNEMFKSPDKFSNVLKKLNQVKRDKDLENFKKLDFFEDPEYIRNAKKEIQDYVERTKTWKDKAIHFFNIFSQFSNNYNSENELYDKNLSVILKTKRVEYVTTLPRFDAPDEIVDRMSMIEQAEYNFVNDIKLWGQKYAVLSCTLGINFSVLLFYTIFRNHHRFARSWFSLLGGWIVYVYLTGKALDKIYYPLQPVFKKYRELEKKYGSEEFNKIASFSDDLQPTPSQQHTKEKFGRAEALKKIEQVDAEILQEREIVTKTVNNLVHDLHLKYINEEDFDEDTERYKEFIDQYIYWYFEPLVPEYDEAKFSIHHFEDKFSMKAGWKGIKKKNNNSA